MVEEIDKASEEEKEEEKEAQEEPTGTEAKSERVRSKRYELYETENGEVKREKKFCPRCGPGVFLADHEDRLSCGKCGYTEFKE